MIADLVIVLQAAGTFCSLAVLLGLILAFCAMVWFDR